MRWEGGRGRLRAGVGRGRRGRGKSKGKRAQTGKAFYSSGSLREPRAEDRDFRAKCRPVRHRLVNASEVGGDWGGVVLANPNNFRSGCGTGFVVMDSSSSWRSGSGSGSGWGI